jgi:two-component sensor histidine kinase
MIDQRALRSFVGATARSVASLTLICAVCAVIVTYVIRLQSTLWQSMVFSLCVGGATMLLIRGGYRLIWGDNKPSRFGFACLIAVAIPLAFMLGSSVAATVLDLPVSDFGLSHLHANAGIVILTVLASIFSTWFFWTQARLERLNAATAAIEQQATRARLQMLQAQIEPHMLFNTLANLQGLIALDPARAQLLLDQLIVYLRATLSSSRTATTTLAHEFDLMQAYLALMSVRMGKRLTYRLDLPAELREAVVAPMLLQPLVENALKHGLEPKLEGGSILVSARRDGTVLTLLVSDTGLGLNLASSNQSQLGVTNVRERLQALHGDAAILTLTPNLPAGTLAQLTLPIGP